jgi:hypothetical protein
MQGALCDNGTVMLALGEWELVYEDESDQLKSSQIRNGKGALADLLRLTMKSEAVVKVL